MNITKKSRMFDSNFNENNLIFFTDKGTILSTDIGENLEKKMI